MKTYKEQFDKLTTAYIKLEVNPFHGCNCFVGNLLDGDLYWDSHRNYEAMRVGLGAFCIRKSPYQTKWGHEYTLLEVIEMEKVFLDTFEAQLGARNIFVIDKDRYDNPRMPYRDELKAQGINMEWEQYSELQENALFKAFEAALDVLKQIHIKRGEPVEEAPVFVKRKYEAVL